MKHNMIKLFASNRDNETISAFRLVTGLFVLCLCVRGFLAVNTIVVGGDACSFLWGVRNLAMGSPYDSVIKDKPLFQILVYGIQQVIGNPIIAGQMVTVFFSSLTVVFLFPLFRDYFSTSVALLATLLYILHPTINDELTKIITDGTFICFFIGGLFLFHRYVYSRYGWKKWVYLVGSFILSVLAIATRPEAALLFLIHSVTMIVLLFRGRRDKGIEWTAITGLVLYVVIPALAGYLALGETFLDLLKNPGKYSGNVSNMLSVLSGESSINPFRKWSWYSEAFDEFLELGYYHLNLFLVIGLFTTTWKARPRKRILYFSYFVLYYLAVLLSTLGNTNSEYINERYLMIGFILLLPLIAGGIAWTYDWIRTDWNRPNTALIILAIVMIALLPRTLEKGFIPRNTKNLGMKRSGQWINNHGNVQEPRLLSTDKKSAYYAGVDKSKVERVRKLPNKSINELIEHSSADYLVFSHDTINEYPALKQVEDHPDLKLLFTAKRGTKGIHTPYVYRIQRK